jgi:hypothetical protein
VIGLSELQNLPSWLIHAISVYMAGVNLFVDLLLYTQTFPTTRQALWPPKPKELLRAMLTLAFRAFSGT